MSGPAPRASTVTVREPDAVLVVVAAEASADELRGGILGPPAGC
jgi:hypothetical protein